MTRAGSLPGDSVRLLIVGAGGVARRHAEVLTRLGADVVAVADPVEESARALAAAYGARAFADADEALAAGAVDGVYVCVPPFAHGAPERATLARGLPMFVEKPVAADLAAAEALAREVAAAGVVTGTGYHWRCLDTLPRAVELLRRQPAVLATGAWVGGRPPPPWWSRRSLGGGQVVEQLTHLLDLARLLLGEPEEVHATSVRRAGADSAADAGDAVEDATAATVRFSSGAVATFATSCVLDSRLDASLRLVAPGVALTLTEDALVVAGGGEESTHPVREDPRVAIDRDFLEVVRGERPETVAPYDEALRSHRLGCAITAAARPPDGAEW